MDKFLFNLRVYGILLTTGKQVLVSDELIRGRQYTKFPGGGLEPGEGTRDCLVREFMEEMNLRVSVGDHIYTTDFFQPSAFHNNHQIISIYYFVTPLEPFEHNLKKTPFDFGSDKTGGDTEVFRLVEWDDFSEESVTLPIDKIVARMLKQV
jgi:8-oxo-dGTP pyrophosphatase MutT (NUDIX family)